MRMSRERRIGTAAGHLVQPTQGYESRRGSRKSNGLRCQFTNLVAWKNFSPAAAQQLQARQGTCFAGVCYFLFTMETANRTVDLYQAPPPNHRLEPFELHVRMARSGLPNAQRHECAGIPECGRFRHDPASLSA